MESLSCSCAEMFLVLLLSDCTAGAEKPFFRPGPVRQSAVQKSVLRNISRLQMFFRYALGLYGEDKQQVLTLVSVLWARLQLDFSSALRDPGSRHG